MWDDIPVLTDEGIPKEILAEAYKGKSKQLLELEKMIGENRKKYYGTFKVGGGYYTDKDFVKIGDKIAKIFNFKVVDFNIMNDPTLNACTIPAGFSLAISQNIGNAIVTDSKENMYFKYNSLSTVIRVTSGLWTNKTFTDGEITAAILHEVGHNFQHKVNSGLRAYAVCMVLLRFINFIRNLCSGHIISGIKRFLSQEPVIVVAVNKFVKDSGLGFIVNIYGGITGFFKLINMEASQLIIRGGFGIPETIISVARAVEGNIMNPFDGLFNIINSVAGKGGENIADTWTTEHGYGPELTSFFLKMSLDPNASPSGTFVEKLSKKLPLYDNIYTLFTMPCILLSWLLDPHPRDSRRIQNVVFELEKNLEKSDVTPAMKKEIKKQIKEVKEIVDSYTEIKSPIDGMALRKVLFKSSIDYGKDPKLLLTKAFSQKDLIETSTEMDLGESMGDGMDLSHFYLL